MATSHAHARATWPTWPMLTRPRDGYHKARPIGDGTESQPGRGVCAGTGTAGRVGGRARLARRRRLHASRESPSGAVLRPGTGRPLKGLRLRVARVRLASKLGHPARTVGGPASPYSRALRALHRLALLQQSCTVVPEVERLRDGLASSTSSGRSSWRPPRSASHRRRGGRASPADATDGSGGGGAGSSSGARVRRSCSPMGTDDVAACCRSSSCNPEFVAGRRWLRGELRLLAGDGDLLPVDCAPRAHRGGVGRDGAGRRRPQSGVSLEGDAVPVSTCRTSGKELKMRRATLQLCRAEQLDLSMRSLAAAAAAQSGGITAGPLAGDGSIYDAAAAPLAAVGGGGSTEPRFRQRRDRRQRRARRRRTGGADVGHRTAPPWSWASDADAAGGGGGGAHLRPGGGDARRRSCRWRRRHLERRPGVAPAAGRARRRRRRPPSGTARRRITRCCERSPSSGGAGRGRASSMLTYSLRGRIPAYMTCEHCARAPPLMEFALRSTATSSPEHSFFTTASQGWAARLMWSNSSGFIWVKSRFLPRIRPAARPPRNSRRPEPFDAATQRPPRLSGPGAHRLRRWPPPPPAGRWRAPSSSALRLRALSRRSIALAPGREIRCSPARRRRHAVVLQAAETAAAKDAAPPSPPSSARTTINMFPTPFMTFL